MRRTMRFEGEQTLLRIYLRNTDRSGWANTTDAACSTCAWTRSWPAPPFPPAFAGWMFRAICSNRTGGRWCVPFPRSLRSWTALEPSAFLPTVDDIVDEGLATLERSHVLVHRKRGDSTTQVGLEIPAAPSPFANLPSPEEFPIMKRSEEGQLLRIFIDNSDLLGKERLYTAIVHKAHQLGLTWAAVLRPEGGFGAHHRFHTSVGSEYVSEQPILIEIVDTSEKIQSLLPFVDEVVSEGLVTIEGVRLIRFLPERV